MNLTFDHRSAIVNEKSDFVAIFEDTYDITKLEQHGQTIVFEGVQFWDKKPELLPKGTVIRITFSHARLEDSAEEGHISSRKDLVGLWANLPFEPTETDKKAGYEHGVRYIVTRDGGESNEADDLRLLYKDAVVSYTLPQ
ncbi:hypothetical protein HGB24_03365 [Candidatus Saccharibacteria bacterium]|nr:hypothetical protein [Candidatus Saccharibacteria bacterium]